MATIVITEAGAPEPVVETFADGDVWIDATSAPGTDVEHIPDAPVVFTELGDGPLDPSAHIEGTVWMRVLPT